MAATVRAITRETPGAHGLEVGEGAAVLLPFHERSEELRPKDEAGSLTQIRDATPALTAPPIADALTGPGRVFGDGLGFLATDPDDGALLARDVTIQALVLFDHAAQDAAGEPGVIFARGDKTGAAQYRPYGLRLDVPATGQGRLEFFWDDLSGVESVQTGGDFNVPAGGYVLLTAVREWVSDVEVKLWYYANETLLAAVTSTDGEIGGGVGGTVTIGCKLESGTYDHFLRGTVDQLKVSAHAHTAEEVEATYRRIAVWQPAGTAALARLWPTGDGFPNRSVGSEFMRHLQVRGELVGALAAHADNERRNHLPNRAYGGKLADWERVLGLDTLPGAEIQTRRDRCVAVIRRRLGLSVESLQAGLVTLFGFSDEADVEILEYSHTLVDDASEPLSELLWTVEGNGSCETVGGDVFRLTASSGADLRYDVDNRDDAIRVLTSIDDPHEAAIHGKVVAGGYTSATKMVGLCMIASNGDAVFLGYVADATERVGYRVYSGGVLGAFVELGQPTGPLPVFLRLQHSVSAATYTAEYGELSATMDAEAVFAGPATPVWAGMFALDTAEPTPSALTADMDLITLHTPNGTTPLHWYGYRNPTKAGTWDLGAARLQATKQGPARSLGGAVTLKALVCDDPDHGCGNTPLGSRLATRFTARAAELYELWAQATWPDGILQLNEAAGPAVDAIGGLSFAAGGSPSFQDATPWTGHHTVAFSDGATDRLEAPNATLLDLGTSFALLCAFRMSVAGATRSLCGNRETGANEGWEVRIGAGSVTMTVDVGASVNNLSIGTGYDDSAWHVLAIGVDYANSLVWYRSDLGSGSTALTVGAGGSNAQPFALGALASGFRASAPIDYAWASWIVGARAEGISGTDLTTPMIPWLT